MSTPQPSSITIEKVANGYLVREPLANRTERVFIAESPFEAATIMERDIWPDLGNEAADPPFDDEPPIAETVDQLTERFGIVTGADIPASAGSAPTDDVTYTPATDDGYEWPKVERKGSRWTIHCPNHGPQRGEFRDNGEFLRCTMRDGKTLCAHPGTPKQAAQRMANGDAV